MQLIEFFNIKGQNQISPSSTCGSCNLGCDSVAPTIPSVIADFNERYNDQGTIVWHELTEENLETVAKRLQVLYQNSGESLIITESNVRYILSKLNPILAIDDKLVANNYIPDADELQFAIEHGQGIYPSTCS